MKPNGEYNHDDRIKEEMKYLINMELLIINGS